ncbi:MAG: DUF72 domain-containing protein, partial [Gemmatimonadaceae bacterium]|nr:DUF72 domain-containing protein [Gemmatimonadaceae bacterium]
DLAMVRLHGRRAATWEAAKVPTVERYRYLYDEAELGAWAPKVEAAAAEAKRTVVLLNNCYGNYGAANAQELVARLSGNGAARCSPIARVACRRRGIQPHPTGERADGDTGRS